MRIGGDDFDRLGALGAQWAIPQGSFSCDGDRANAADAGSPGGINPVTGLPYPPVGASTNVALFIAALGIPSYGLGHRYAATIVLPAAGTGVFELGILFGYIDFAYWAQGSNPGGRGIELYYLSTDDKLYIARRLFDGTRQLYWSSAALGWAAGQVHQIEATWFSDSTSRVTVAADGATLVTGLAVALPSLNAGIATPAVGGWNRVGIHYHRTTTAPGQGAFGLLEVYDLATGFSVEGTPAFPAFPSLTTVVVAGEAAATGTAVPVEPDSAIDLGVEFYVAAVAQGSGWVTRFPTLSQDRTFLRFTWNNRTLADRDAILSWIDDPAGAAVGLNAVPWTSAEAEAFNLYFLPGTVTWSKTGPETYNLAAAFLKAHT